MAALKMRMLSLLFPDQIWVKLMRRERALRRSKGGSKDISRPPKRHKRTVNKQQVVMAVMQRKKATSHLIPSRDG